MYLILSLVYVIYLDTSTLLWDILGFFFDEEYIKEWVYLDWIIFCQPGEITETLCDFKLILAETLLVENIF